MEKLPKGYRVNVIGQREDGSAIFGTPYKKDTRNSRKRRRDKFKTRDYGQTSI